MNYYNGNINDVLSRIDELKNDRNWSEYELSRQTGLTQSTISSWYRKNMLPTLPSLERICAAFNMTLSQFFLDSNTTPITLTEEQTDLLDTFSRLSPEQRKKLISFLKSL